MTEGWLKASWLLVRATDLPADDAWLTWRERGVLQRLRRKKRREDWRLGRWAAKGVALARGVAANRTAVEVLAQQDGAPELWVGGAPSAAKLSLSHSHGVGFAAIGAEGAALGCDLEAIEPRPPGFAEDYLTPVELRSVTAAADAAMMTTLFWSAKESALKALCVGLRADTRSVEVDLGEGAKIGRTRGALVVRQVNSGRLFDGRWWCHEGFVMTLVTDPQLSELDEIVSYGTRAS